MILRDEEVRYPAIDDKFFIDVGSPEEIAWLHKTFQQFGSYADSYQVGAINLINSGLENENIKDYIIYPAIFLIRHYLELRLKELIQGINYSKNQNKEFPIHHNLQNLWGDFKKAYLSIGENTSGLNFETIDILIKEMSSIDPISMSFRYPVDTVGKNIQKLKYVNLSNLKETFIRVSFVLDGVSMQIAHFVDITEEMMQDVYSNYW